MSWAHPRKKVPRSRRSDHFMPSPDLSIMPDFQIGNGLNSGDMSIAAPTHHSKTRKNPNQSQSQMPINIISGLSNKPQPQQENADRSRRKASIPSPTRKTPSRLTPLSYGSTLDMQRGITPEVWTHSPPPVKPEPSRKIPVQRSHKTTTTIVKKPVLPNIGVGERLLIGDLNNLPLQQTNIITVFLSSTFSDFKAERNALAKIAYPELKQYCSEKGFDFKVVDLRWGITASATNDHSVEEICLVEIERCQRLCPGPNFVTMLGQRYGFQPIPSKVEAGEFELLRAIAEENKVEGRVLLDNWYKKDNNFEHPVYILQPIDVRVPDFLNEDETCSNEGLKKWQMVERTLQSVLRQCVNIAASKGKLSKERKRSYYMSGHALDLAIIMDIIQPNPQVTEQEIEQGIFSAPGAKASCLCFIRRLEGLEKSLADEDASRHIDTVTAESGVQEINQEVMGMRKQLINKICTNLPTDNIGDYSVQWKPKGIQVSTHPEHDEYVKQLCESFVSNMKKLVDNYLKTRDKDILLESSMKLKSRNVSQPAKQTKGGISKSDFFLGKLTLNTMESALKNLETDNTPHVDEDRTLLSREILHHLLFCKSKCDLFCGRDLDFQEVKSRLKSKQSRRTPLVLYGSSGSGKTSFMAMLAKRSKEWFSDNCVTIIRFLGTSPSSADIRRVLKGLCYHICLAYGETCEFINLHKMSMIVKYFNHLLIYVSMKYASQRPLVILLDGIDQLSAGGNSHKLHWLPKVVPANVHFVVSMLPEFVGAAENHLQMTAEFLEISPFEESTFQEFVLKYSKLRHRKFTESQEKLIISSFMQENCNLLHMRMVLDLACSWPSYKNVDQTDLSSCAKEAISALFGKLKTKLGAKFVEFSLGYITAGNVGLTEIELEDVLSCNDEVLAQVYRHHNPPLDGIVRIPDLMWSRLRYHLSEYFVERYVYGKTVISWYHRQFKETAMALYADGNKGIHLHDDLAKLYLCETPVLLDIELPYRKLVVSKADRQVSLQPLISSNHRRLTSLPYHFTKARDANGLTKHCFCNLEYLKCYILGFSVNDLLFEMSQSLELMEDPHIQKVYDCLKFSSCEIQSNVENLAVQLLGQLVKERDSHEPLRDLCNQAKDYIMESGKPSFLPIINCISGFSSSLKWYMNGPKTILTHNKNRSLLLLDTKETFQVFNTHSLEVISSIRLPVKTQSSMIVQCVLADQRVFVLTKKILYGFLISSGELLHQINIDINKGGLLNECFAVSSDEQHIALAGEARLGVMREIMDEEQYIGQCAMSFTGSTETSNITFSHDNCHTISTHTIKGKNTIGAVALWDFMGKEIKNRVALPTPVPRGLLYVIGTLAEHDILLCGLQNGQILIIDITMGKIISEIGRPQIPSNVANLPNAFDIQSNLLVTSDPEKHCVSIFSVDISNSSLILCENTNVNVTCVEILPDDQHIVLGDDNGNLNVFQIVTQTGQIVTFSELAAGASNEKCKLNLSVSLKGVTDSPVTCMLTVQDSILSCGGKMLKQFDIEDELENLLSDPLTSRMHEGIELDEENVSMVQCATEGQFVITVSTHGVKMWRLSKGTLIRVLHEDVQQTVSSMRISDDDKLLVLLLGSENGHSENGQSAIIWDLNTGLNLLPRKFDNIVDTLFYKDELYLLATRQHDSSQKYHIQKYLPMENKLEDIVNCQLAVEDCGLLKTNFFLQGKKYLIFSIYSEDNEFYIKALDTSSGEVINCDIDGDVQAQSLFRCSAAFGSSCVFLCSKNDAYVWELPSNTCQKWKVDGAIPKIQRKGKGARKQADALICAMDVKNDSVVLGCENGMIVVWRVPPREGQNEYTILKGHTGEVGSVCLSHDCSRLISASEDHTLRLWDVNNGTLLTVLNVHSPVIEAHFTTDDCYVIAITNMIDIKKTLILNVVGKESAFITM